MIDKTLKNEIKRIIDKNDIDVDNFHSVDDLLEETVCTVYGTQSIKYKYVRYIKFLLNCGANREKFYNQIINSDDYDTFKYLVEQIKIKICEIRQDKERNEKLQKQLDNWLEEKCKNLNNDEDIKFLFFCGAEKKIIYDQIKESILKDKFNKFKYFVEKFKELEISLEEIRKEEEWKEKLQTQLDSWLEKKYRDVKQNRNDINFLICCGATKKEALKKSIEKENFCSFIFLVEEDKSLLEEIKMEQEVEERLKKQLNNWLEEKCNKKDEKDIKFLLDCEASKEIIYTQIKNSIVQNNFYNFNFFVENFKECGISLEEIRKEEEWKEKLQTQLDSWLEKKSYERIPISRFDYYSRDRDKFRLNIVETTFLIKCGANIIVIENKIKYLIGKYNNFDEFKFIVENFKKYGVFLEKIKKEKEWNERLQIQLDNWLEEKYRDEYNENAKKFLKDCGASEEEALKISIEKDNKISFNNIIRRNILSREDIKELKINNETLIRELIEYIYEENGLESRTLENKIMRSEKFDEETKKIIIEIVSKTHPARANVLKMRLKG